MAAAAAAAQFWSSQAVYQQVERVRMRTTRKAAVVAIALNGDVVEQGCEAVAVENALVWT
jgi:hypothetical protein